VELHGSNYLYALATVSITFAAFSALLLIFRQAMGGALTRYESYFVLSFILVGFLVTGGCLLPPMLALYGWPPTTVWRVSSLVMTIPVLTFAVTLPRRRRAAGHHRIPLYVWILLFVQGMIALYLLMNALGTLVETGVAPYAAAMTGLLFSGGIGYVIALAAALGEPPKRSS
jgi:hypothetical protein